MWSFHDVSLDFWHSSLQHQTGQILLKNQTCLDSTNVHEDISILLFHDTQKKVLLKCLLKAAKLLMQRNQIQHQQRNEHVLAEHLINYLNLVQRSCPSYTGWYQTPVFKLLKHFISIFCAPFKMQHYFTDAVLIFFILVFHFYSTIDLFSKRKLQLHLTFNGLETSPLL